MAKEKRKKPNAARTKAVKQSSSVAPSVVHSVQAAFNERVASVRDSGPRSAEPGALLEELRSKRQKYRYCPELQMQDNDDASRAAAAVWSRTEEASSSHQDQAEEPPPATKILDCAVHLERNVKRVGDCGKDIWEDKMQPDINRVKRLPTLPLVFWLLKLFEAIYNAVCPNTTQYYVNHMHTLKTTRAHAGPGMADDNNGLEGTNKYQKDCQRWTRLGITKFAMQLRDFSSARFLDDKQHGLNFMHAFSTSIWNKDFFIRVEELLSSKVLELTFTVKSQSTGTVMHIMPRERALEFVNLKLKQPEIVAALAPHKSVFVKLMGKGPEAAMPDIVKCYPKSTRVGFHEVLSWVDSFALLQPLQASETFTNGLWGAMGVPLELRDTAGPLMRCGCGSYMQHSVCHHVVGWHFNAIQTADHETRQELRGADGKQLVGRSFWELCNISGWLQTGTVGHVNNAQKIVGRVGRPRTQIRPGSALSRD